MKFSAKWKAEQLQTMRVTENPVNYEEKYYGYKYFIEFNNTHKIVGAFKTQRELEERLDEIIRDGVNDNGGIFY